MWQAGKVLDQEQVHSQVLAAALDWLAEMDVLNGRMEDTELLVQVGVEGLPPGRGASIRWQALLDQSCRNTSKNCISFDLPLSALLHNPQ